MKESGFFEIDLASQPSDVNTSSGEQMNTVVLELDITILAP